jgi:hypothetical protein
MFEQQATGLVSAALRRLDQPFNLATGEVIPVAAAVSLLCRFFLTAPAFPPGRLSAWRPFITP